MIIFSLLLFKMLGLCVSGNLNERKFEELSKDFKANFKKPFDNFSLLSLKGLVFVSMKMSTNQETIQ